MAVLYTPHFVQFFDSNGDPLSGGLLYTYAAGTTTPKATYTTSAGTVENTNPIVLNSAGRAVLFIDGSYKFVLHNSEDVPIPDGETDNITAFTTTGAAEDSFFETFSGDGSTKVFTLSETQGTDEKVLSVVTEFEYSVNGSFATDSDWTKGSGWSIGSGVATATGDISTSLEQDAALTLIQGQLYTVTMAITRSAGSITPNIGGTAGTARSSAGTYTENIIAGSTQKITFSTSGFTGTLDNVKVTKVSGAEPISTSLFTINGTSLTFTVAPASGTNNIKVWNWARLAGAASAAASAAATSENNAAASAASAADDAATLTPSTSTTSVAIGTGSKTFTIESGKGWVAGQWALITSDADKTNYMHGQITSYSSTTLIVNVTNVGGSGTLADWTISLSGTRGAQGDAGTLSATSGVTAATSAGASLISSGANNCLTWGSGGSANTTLGGNMSGASTYKLVSVLNVYGVKNTIGSIGGGTQDIDLDSGRTVTATVDTGTTTFTFSNADALDAFDLYLTNGGSQTVNWPASVDWAGGVAPTLTASGVDHLVFTTIDGGTTWYGYVAGLDM